MAVLPLQAANVVPGIDEKDVSFTYTRGSGPGGQHRNKTESCVTAVHRPSGLQARVDLRSQHQSKAMALRVLAARVKEAEVSRVGERQNQTRREQIGSGMRGDKIRTYRTQDNLVTDHRTGAKWKLDRWMKGEW